MQFLPSPFPSSLSLAFFASRPGSLTTGDQASDQSRGKSESRYRRGAFPPPPKSVRIVRLAEDLGEPGSDATTLADSTRAGEQSGMPCRRGFKSPFWPGVIAGLVVLVAGLAVLWLL
jgi:hypothetical protein